MTQATPAQQRIWAQERARPAGRAHHLALAVHVDGPADLAALTAAGAAVLARHESLRHAVTADADGVAYLVPAARTPSVTRVAWYAGLVGDELARPFDLDRGPLARFVLASAAPDRHLLLFVAHRLVFDEVSQDVLLRDLAAAYAGTALRPLAFGYTAHAKLHRDLVDGLLPGAHEFWRERRPPRPDPVLPGLRAVPTGAVPGATVELAIDAGLSRALGCTADALGVTRFELLLTSVLALLRRYGDPDPVVTVEVSTRTPDVADHIGLFVNPLPIASAGATFAQLAAATRAELRAADRLRSVPVPAGAGPVSLSYRRPAAVPSFAGVAVRVERNLFAGTVHNALHLQAVDTPPDLVISLRYSPAAYDDGAVARIGGHLRTLLTAAVAEPRTPVADLPLLPPAELDLVVRRPNATAVAYPRGATVVNLFLDQAHVTPDAVAAGAGGTRLSYADLDTVTGRLAGRLRRRGVRPGSLVALDPDRSLDALVAVLGVARSGAAYLPAGAARPAGVPLLTAADLAGLDTDDEADDPPGPDDIAYLRHPDGSAVPHGVLANLLLALRDRFGGGPQVWAGRAPLASAGGPVELFLPLITGGQVTFDPTGRVTHRLATPAGWLDLLDAATPLDPDLVAVVDGADSLSLELARRLRTRVARVFTWYAPAGLPLLLDEVATSVDAVRLGGPLANTQVYLLDDRLRPVPLGLPGEMYAGGAGAYAAGPLVADPYGPPGTRLYRTGALARREPDGRVVLVGRVRGAVTDRPT